MKSYNRTARRGITKSGSREGALPCYFSPYDTINPPNGGISMGLQESDLFDLSVVSETLFIPLYCRAIETQSKDPIIRDPKAVEVTQRLNSVFRASDKKLFRNLARGKLPSKLPVTVALKSRKLDEYVLEFLESSPGGVVVSLGCGLDTRFTRVDNGTVEWYDLDFPDVIELRRRFFKESDRYHFIESSVLDFTWMDTLAGKKGRPFLFLAEGLFMYLHENDVKSLVLKLQSEFPGSLLVAEVSNSYVVRGMKGWWGRGKFRRQFGLSEDVVYHFGISRSDELEGWGTGIRFLDEWTYFDEDEKKLGWFNWFKNIRMFRYAQWVVRYRLG